MELLAAQFGWWLPLAGLPILIHLLNRLRYQSVPWAAMMFLRKADRESTRRARLRQWLILAMRTLALLAFLLALLRPLYQGALARFLSTSAELVVIVFDRSASMEQLSAGRSARERALRVLQDALSEFGDRSRILLLDSVSRELLPVGSKVALDRLPGTRGSATAADMNGLLQQALAAVKTEAQGEAEIWIATDLQASNWDIPGKGVVDPDVQERVRIRVLDVGAPSAGNLALQRNGMPRRQGDTLTVPLAISRDGIGGGETIPLLIEREGSRLRRDLKVEGTRYEWEEQFDCPPDELFTVTLRLPDDANAMDNTLYLSVPSASLREAEVACSSPGLEEIVTAGLLPRKGQCSVRPVGNPDQVPRAEASLRVQDSRPMFSEAWREWIAGGGLLLLLPADAKGGSLDWKDQPGVEALALVEWNEGTGPLRLGSGRRPLRLDLLAIAKRELLSGEGLLGGGTDVLATHVDGSAFLLRESRGSGAVYSLSTLPFREWSTLGEGYLWVPLLQRLLEEGRDTDQSQGTHTAGEWREPEGQLPWRNDDGRDPAFESGLYVKDGRWLALNPPAAESDPSRISVEELEEAYAPLSVRVFREPISESEGSVRRVELAPWLTLVALMALFVECILLLRVSRRASRRPLQGGAPS